MKLFTAVYDDIRLLTHFLKHYAAAGIGEFYVLSAPVFVREVRAFAEDYELTAVEVELANSFRHGNIAVNEMRDVRRAHQQDDEWAVVVDLDEFVELRDTLHDTVVAAEAERANVIRGIMYDRFAADGRMVDVSP